MSRETYPQLTHKRRSFFSTLTIGICSVIVVATLCVTTVGLYGLTIVDRKTGGLLEFASETLRNIPEFAESLPPLFADVVNDTRNPEYAKNLAVSATLDAYKKGGELFRPTLRIQNLGEEMVSLLSLHVVVLDDTGSVRADFTEWGATPLALDRDWPGPMLPGATRSLAGGYCRVSDDWNAEDLRVEVEITDVRTWNKDAPPRTDKTRQAADKSESEAAQAASASLF
jgi:hypothetical protein